MEQMINKDVLAIAEMKLGDFGGGFFRLKGGKGEIFYFEPELYYVHPVLENKTISNLLSNPKKEEPFPPSTIVEILSWESVGVTKIQWAND
jgi:hypothetical protein